MFTVALSSYLLIVGLIYFFADPEEMQWSPRVIALVIAPLVLLAFSVAGYYIASKERE
jgi:hypothetical protein